MSSPGKCMSPRPHVERGFIRPCFDLLCWELAWAGEASSRAGCSCVHAQEGKVGNLGACLCLISESFMGSLAAPEVFRATDAFSVLLLK